MYLGFFIAAKLKIAARILIYVSLVKKISWGISINLISWDKILSLRSDVCYKILIACAMSHDVEVKMPGTRKLKLKSVN